jgi:ABC-type transport system involved in cytochrome c biogenesis permease subunit
MRGLLEFFLQHCLESVSAIQQERDAAKVRDGCDCYPRAMTLIDLANPTRFLSLWRAVDDPSRAARAAAVLTLVGAINLPITKFSVDWWNTLHQPASVFRMGGPTLDRAFLIPLLVMAGGFTLLFVTLHVAAIRNELLRRRVRALQMMQARASSSDVSAASPASQPA